MQLLKNEGVVDSEMLRILNGNFAELSAVVSQQFWIDPVNGNDNNSGQNSSEPRRTISNIVQLLRCNAQVILMPGRYDEPLITIGRTQGGIGGELNNIQFIGIGGRGSAFIEPSTEDQGGMVIHADDVTLVNVGVAGEDSTSAVALIVTGVRFRAYGCKIEGGLTQLQIGPGTDAQITAGTRGDGSDGLLEDCEVCWGTNGIILAASDYGAVTQLRVRKTRFHDLSAASFEESGPSADIVFRGLVIDDCVFEPNEDGTSPTKYISLDGDNANAGVVTKSEFPVALDSGLNLVSTALKWVGNLHPAGLSTTQPS